MDKLIRGLKNPSSQVRARAAGPVPPEEHEAAAERSAEVDSKRKTPAAGAQDERQTKHERQRWSASVHAGYDHFRHARAGAGRRTFLGSKTDPRRRHNRFRWCHLRRHNRFAGCASECAPPQYIPTRPSCRARLLPKMQTPLHRKPKKKFRTLRRRPSRRTI